MKNMCSMFIKKQAVIVTYIFFVYSTVCSLYIFCKESGYLHTVIYVHTTYDHTVAICCRMFICIFINIGTKLFYFGLLCKTYGFTCEYGKRVENV
jgi:hypothetical protein